MADIEIREHPRFGRYYDLDKHLPGATAMVVAHGQWGIKPDRLMLTHQLYERDVPAGETVYVLPVLTPWLQISGEHAGQWTGPRDSVTLRRLIKALGAAVDGGYGFR